MVVYFVRKEDKTHLVLFGVCLYRKMYNKFFVFFCKQETKSGALKKTSRYRSRSLSASSTDSYSSGNCISFM